MSQCPDCGCDLPGFQTLGSECYDAKYAGVGRPKRFLESIRQFGSNPRRRQEVEDRINAQPWWLAWCFAVIGLGFDWRCAFEWFAGNVPFYSELVLGRAMLIVYGPSAPVSRVDYGLLGKNLAAPTGRLGGWCDLTREGRSRAIFHRSAWTLPR